MELGATCGRPRHGNSRFVTCTASGAAARSTVEARREARALLGAWQGNWLLGLLLDACPPPDGAEVAAIAREGVQMVLGQVLAAAS